MTDSSLASVPRQRGFGEMNPEILLVGYPNGIQECARALMAQDAYFLMLESNGDRALECMSGFFDALVVDLELPPFNDPATMAAIGSVATPTLVVTSREDANDAIAACESGADDYLKKPFRPVELAARVRMLLRRGHWEPRMRAHGAIIIVDDLIVDPAALRVWRAGHEISLSVTEFNLLLALIQNRGKVLSRAMLIEKAWMYQFLGNSRLVDMTIARLRSKIEEDPRRPRFIHTVRGVGYRLEAERTMADLKG